MHSSYGLAFVVLFVGAGVLVVADVRGVERLPVAALGRTRGRAVRGAADRGWAGAYDPQRMRYVAFSVALAATLSSERRCA